MFDEPSSFYLSTQELLPITKKRILAIKFYPATTKQPFAPFDMILHNPTNLPVILDYLR